MDDSVHLLNVETREAKPVMRNEYGSDSSFDWSPDGRWLAFAVGGRNGFGAIHLYEVATAKATRVTDGMYDDGNVNFDLNGKYLYFTSARAFAPTPGCYELSLKVENADRVYLLPLTKEQGNPFFPKPEDAEETPPKPDAKAEKPPAGPPPVRVDVEGLGRSRPSAPSTSATLMNLTNHPGRGI